MSDFPKCSILWRQGSGPNATAQLPLRQLPVMLNMGLTVARVRSIADFE